MKLNNLDLNKLLVFYEVYRVGGVSKAAVQLALTPSAISQSIRQLESTLGRELFERDGRRIVPTHAAERLAENLGEIFARLDHQVNAIQCESDSVSGKIKLGVFYGCSDKLTASVIRRIHAQHPNIRISVSFGSPSELDHSLQSGMLDFCINLFKSKMPNIHRHLLMTDQLWLVSSRKPPARSLEFEELRQAPFIDYFASSQMAVAWINHHFGKRVRKLPVTINAANSALVLQLILDGAGIGVVASSIAKPMVEMGRLYLIRGLKAQLESPIWLKSTKNSGKSAAGRAVLEVVTAAEGVW